MNKGTEQSAEFAAECERIDNEKKSIWSALKAANDAGITGRDIDAIMRGFDTLEVATDALKERFYRQRSGRLIISLGSAILVSPTGRTQRVWTAARTNTDLEESN